MIFPLGLDNGTISQAVTINSYKHYSLLDGNHYKFELGFKTPFSVLPNSWSKLETRVDFSYVKEHTYVDDLGLRIKRISDFTKNNSTSTNIKRFYYKESDKITESEESSYEVYNRPHYLKLKKEYNTDEQTQTSGVNSGQTFIYIGVPKYIAELSSNSFQELMPISDSNSLYRNVTISYGGDNFENGGIEKKFNIINNQTDNVFSSEDLLYEYTLKKFHTNPHPFLLAHIRKSIKNNKNIVSGNLIQELYLKNNNQDQLLKLKKIDFFI